MASKLVVVAGASGNLGLRIVRALGKRNLSVRALVRENTDPSKLGKLKAAGAETIIADLKNVDKTAKVIEGASCVLSSLLGLREVMVERQSDLLNAALKAGVKRFIPSDYCIDFTKLSPGDNRNLDLHREFQRIIDDTDIQATSVLNGCFMDLLTGDAPMIRFKLHKILYWENAEQLLDFTTMDDTADFTAAAAADDETPRYLKIAGEVTNAEGIAKKMTAVTGEKFGLIKAGSLENLVMMSKIAKTLTPPTDDPFPAWQGMQYFANMFDGRAKLEPLDNNRYPDLKWTSFEAFIAQRQLD